MKTTISKTKTIQLTESEQKILSELLNQEVKRTLILNDSQSKELFNKLIDCYSEDVEVKEFIMSLGKELKK